jgi:hypothetical protein
MDLMMMERVCDRWEKMEGSCSTEQSPQWTVVPVEEEEVCRKGKIGLYVCVCVRARALAQPRSPLKFLKQYVYFLFFLNLAGGHAVVCHPNIIGHAVVCHPNIIVFNLLRSITIRLRTCKNVRRERE